MCRVAVHLVRVADCGQQLGAGSTLGPLRRRICSGDCLEVHILPPREDYQDRVRGDDFVIEGSQEDLDWTKGVLANKYLVKVRSILGPERQDDKVADILNRVVEWYFDALWWEADPWHVKKMLEEIVLEDCKLGAVPGAKRAEEQDGEQELDQETAWKYWSIVARRNFLVQDWPGYTVHGQEAVPRDELPEDAQLGALEKLCQYLQGVPRMVQRVSLVGETSEYLEIFVDSDWAGCQRTRKSTNRGGIVWNGACLKFWSTT